MRSKVTIVGAGNVGATLGQRVAERDYADVVLVDVIPDMPQGKALDILNPAPSSASTPSLPAPTATMRRKTPMSSPSPLASPASPA